MKYEMYCNECGHEWQENEENQNCYECPKCGTISVYRSRFITCQCDNTVYCDNFTNMCDKCGALYNAFGERLASPDQWDDEERYECFSPQN